MRKNRFPLILILLIGLLSPAAAQIDLSPHFLERLEASGVEFLEPAEAGYKDVRVVSNDFLDYDFAIRSRRAQLEIRYLIEPLREDNPAAYAPNVRCIRLVTHLATNEDEQIISGLDVSESDLRENFNADWGKVFFFTPKSGFTRHRYCKMLALFREGQGMAYALFLFDEPARELDYRFYALRFRDI